MARRNRMDIYVDILNAAREGAKKTHLVYQANLNFKIVKGYLEKLTEVGFLKKTGKFFVTTPKGSQFIDQYKDISILAT